MISRTTLAAVLVGTALAFGIVANAEKKPAWQGQIDWATTNETGPDHLGCLSGGGRACLTRLAIQAAKDHDDDAAFRLALVTGCHDPAAVQSLAEAGHELVAEYLRTK
jgi:hypothetical protein